MRTIDTIDISHVLGGQNATASTVEGCGPVREYDVVDCPQSLMGRSANDIANGFAKVSGMLADTAKAIWGFFTK